MDGNLMPEAITLSAETAAAQQDAPYCTKFFGGPDEVCRRLRDAILTARQKKSLTPAYLDTICGFGSTVAKSGTVLPHCSEFEGDPTRNMSSLVFSLAAFPLGLSIDEVLPIALTDKDRQEIARQMESSNARAVRAAGGDRSVAEIPLQEQAEVFVLSKILAEIDARTLRRTGD